MLYKLPVYLISGICHSNRRSAVRSYFPLRSKRVFYGMTLGRIIRSDHNCVLRIDNWTNTFQFSVYYNKSIMPRTTRQLAFCNLSFTKVSFVRSFTCSFSNGPFPTVFYILVFSIQSTVSKCSLKVFRWLDSNLGPLLSKATALPTEPQPLPSHLFLDTTYWWFVINWNVVRLNELSRLCRVVANFLSKIWSSFAKL